MSKWVVDIHGDIEGDYEIIKKYEEPKRGQWIEREYNGIGFIECSECLSGFLKTHLLRNSYCPNCGAKMTESEE